MAISTAYGVSTQYFGDADYQAALLAGHTNSQILAFLERNPGVLHGKHQKGKGGLYDDIRERVTQEYVAQLGTSGSTSTPSLPDYSDQLDGGVDQDAIDAFREEMDEAAKQQRKRERRLLIAQQTQAANAARAGQMAQFKIGTQTPSGQTGGTGQFKRRLQIKPVTSSALSIGAANLNRLPGTNTMLNV